MIKTQNISNNLIPIKQLLEERYEIPAELMNSSEFFTRTEQFQALFLKALCKIEDKIIAQDKTIEKLKEQLGAFYERGTSRIQ